MVDIQEMQKFKSCPKDELSYCSFPELLQAISGLSLQHSLLAWFHILSNSLFTIIIILNSVCKDFPTVSLNKPQIMIDDQLKPLRIDYPDNTWCEQYKS
jgi:hypothetical protein